MYEKRMQLLQKSMKKQFSRKRRRVETLEEGDGEEEEGVGSGRSKEETRLRETVAELEEQLDAERQRGELEYAVFEFLSSLYSCG